MTDQPSIERADVERIARLSRLELDAAALDAMTAHMKNMLAFVAELDRWDRPGISARVHGGDEAGGTARLRPDEVRPSLSVTEALASAPDKGPAGFRVPAILE